MSTHIPRGHRAITPYLHVEGALDFIAFCEAAFGASRVMVHEVDGRVVHAEIAIDGAMLEASDGKPDWPARPCSLHLYVPDADATYAAALAAGAESLYEVTTHDYGERSGGVRDRWGNQWYIGTVVDPAKRAMTDS